MSFHTPLRYPGGKGKLATYIKAILVENDLTGCEYAEVYAGGAGVAIELLQEKYVSCIRINDLNLHVYSFWHSVLNEPAELCELISKTTVTMDEWHRQRYIYAQPIKSCSNLERAFSFFFLNRTNRSGILKAGVIGGKAQEGTWKLDARFTKADLIRRIEQIAKLKSKIRLTRLDGLTFIRTRIERIGSNGFTYLDPPYYVKGAGLYDNSYTHADHEAVAAAMSALSAFSWVVSYDDQQDIRNMYAKFNSVAYSLSYSAANRYQGSEVMFFSPRLVVPSLADYGYQVAA